MYGKRLALGIALFILGFNFAPVLAASDLATPQASQCTVAPIAIGDLQQLVLSGTRIAATPRAAAAITPAITTEIESTIEESVACANANQPLRALALFTNAYLIARFSGAGADDLGHLTAAVTRDSAPAAPADQLTLVSIAEPKALDDGRFSVLVTSANVTESLTDVLIFAPVDGVWRIDETHTAMPIPATPEAQG